LPALFEGNHTFEYKVTAYEFTHTLDTLFMINGPRGDRGFSNLFLMNYEPVVVDVPPIAECEALEVVLEYQEVESCELPRNTFASLNLTSAQAVNLRNISFDLNYEGGLGLLFPLEFSLLHDGDVIATSLGTDNISFDLEDQEPPPGFLINGEDGLDLEIAIKYPPYALAKLISFEDLVINGQEISFGEGSVHSIAAGRMAGAFDFFDIPGSVSTILQADDSISSLDFEEFFGVLNAITYNASFCVQSSLLAANADATEFEGPLTFRNTGKYPMLLTKLFASVQVPYRIHTKSRAIYTINKVDTSGQPGISKSAVSIWLAGEDLAVEQNGVVEQPSNTYIDFLRVIYEIHIEQLKNLHLECNLANAAVNVHNCGLKSRFQVTDLEYFTNSGYFYIPGQSTTMFAHPISWYPNFDLDSYQTLPAGKKQDFKCTITDFTEARQDEGFEEALQELMFAQGQLNLDFDWDLDGLMGDNDSYPFTDQPDAAEDIAEGLIDSFYAGIFDEDSDNWLELDENIILALESTLSFSKRGSQIIVDTPGGEIPSFNAGDFRGDADAAACIGLPAVLEDEESDFYIDRIRPIEYQPPREEDDSDFNIEPLDIEPAEPDFSNASRTDLNLDSIDIEQPEREVPGPPLDL